MLAVGGATRELGVVGRRWEEVALEQSAKSRQRHRPILRPRPLDAVCDRSIEDVSLWAGLKMHDHMGADDFI